MTAIGNPKPDMRDLRHSAARAMINNDVDLHAVGAVLGHRDTRSTARYSLMAAVRKIK